MTALAGRVLKRFPPPAVSSPLTGGAAGQESQLQTAETLDTGSAWGPPPSRGAGGKLRA